MYCRKFHYKAGTFYVGRVHKTQHLFMVLKGESVVWTENGIVSLQQGDVYIGEPGTKRVLFAKTDGFWVTVQRTDKIDIKEMEEELMEPDDTSPFDAFNHLKNSVIELEKIS
jgi:quercetin dioxygenase-like cupin family protein